MGFATLRSASSSASSSGEKGDIRDRNKLVCTVKDFRPDRIINLAAATGAHRPTFGGAKTSAERSQLHTNYADLGEDER